MTTKKMFPEHEKMQVVRAKSQAIGEFLVWLRHEKGVHLATYIEGRDYLRSFRYDTNDILAEFFDIDRDKIEAEKKEMLATIREQNARRQKCE